MWDMQLIRCYCKDETPLTLERCPSSLPQRNTQLPAQYWDVLPPPAPAITQPITSESLSPCDTEMASLVSMYTSPTNSFSIYWVYNGGVPSYTPDDDFSLEDVADNLNFIQSSTAPCTMPSLIPGPFDSPTLISTDNPNSLCFKNPSIL
jgi:hypothetical protein